MHRHPADDGDYGDPTDYPGPREDEPGFEEFPQNDDSYDSEYDAEEAFSNWTGRQYVFDHQSFAAEEEAFYKDLERQQQEDREDFTWDERVAPPPTAHPQPSLIDFPLRVRVPVNYETHRMSTSWPQPQEHSDDPSNSFEALLDEASQEGVATFGPNDAPF
ncbi:MAG: hypothetical protein M3457_22880 [Chloroflexota bacterium]|nr:hypothetical protein [Chloroflexota bacterium]